MNKFVTIGYKKDGKAEVIYPPNVPCHKQKALFREIKGNYVLVEIWSRDSGLVKKRRMTPETKKPKAENTKVEPPKVETPKAPEPPTPPEIPQEPKMPAEPEIPTLEETKENEQ